MLVLLGFHLNKKKNMTDTSDIKVAQSSRSSIDSLENSKEEFKALVAKMDNLISDNSQQVRMSNDASSNGQIGLINKLKIHRRNLHEMLLEMEATPEETWGTIRPAAQKIFEEAAAAKQ